jgi:hydroxymethylpyrimidine/phosphomethylpyrimidine kinase
MTAAPRGAPIALSIAGSDSSGGAGIQADLKTFAAFGVYGASIVTALTAQSTIGVSAVEPASAGIVAAQLRVVLADLDVAAIKTGMLANAAIIEAVADLLRAAAPRPIVVDPVLEASSGDLLLAADAIAAFKTLLLPLAGLLTPNRAEAARLLLSPPAANEAEAVAQAQALRALGPRAVLLKGGHAQDEEAIDVLCDAAGTHRFALPRLATSHGHGTGCTLSAAIAALLASGAPLAEAVVRAKRYVWHALAAAEHLQVGRGRGPLDHLFAIRKGAFPPA